MTVKIMLLLVLEIKNKQTKKQAFFFLCTTISHFQFMCREEQTGVMVYGF